MAEYARPRKQSSGFLLPSPQKPTAPWPCRPLLALTEGLTRLMQHFVLQDFAIDS